MHTDQPIPRSIWLHAWLALSGSAFGFIASYLYLVKARTQADAWAMKMAFHMAAWHLLLTLTLFPVSLLGQRTGARAVQGVSLVFFFIHLGIALANLGEGVSAIAVLNATSGVAFLMTVVHGLRGLATGRVAQSVVP